MMTIRRVQDTAPDKVFLSKIADIPGGVSIKTSELIDGGTLQEGVCVGAKSSGLSTVAKAAKYIAGGSTTAVRVTKGHHFKVGNQLTAKVSGKSYAITVIDQTNASYDVITVGTAIDNPGACDGWVYEGAAEAASNTSALLVTPVAVIGTKQDVVASDNLFTDAWVIATVKSGYVAPLHVTLLKGIVEI